MHLSVIGGRLQPFQVLAAAGADLDARNIDQESPITLAAKHSNILGATNSELAQIVVDASNKISMNQYYQIGI